MKNLNISTEALNAIIAYHLIEMAQSLLKGVQGPEQGLVGEARSDRQQGSAEEAEPGERGVGEIGGVADLMRHIDRMRTEALAESAAIKINGGTYYSSYLDGKASALAELQNHIYRISKERSDLANQLLNRASGLSKSPEN